MTKRDLNIYGIDTNDFAEKCSAEALGKPGGEDISGSRTQSKANAKDGAGTQPGAVKVEPGSEADSRAKSKGN